MSVCMSVARYSLQTTEPILNKFSHQTYILSKSYAQEKILKINLYFGQNTLPLTPWPEKQSKY